MFHLIPAPLHRAALRLAHAIRKRWWRLRKPRLDGCRVIALDPRGHVLLVRHSYGSGWWMPPGGGIARGESPLAAALRELREETGCVLVDPAQVARVVETLHGAGNTVSVVVGHAAETPLADGREIVDARFFAPDALPSDMPEGLRAQLPVWVAAYNSES